MNDINILTTYISSWAWTIISIIFLCSSILFLDNGYNLSEIVLALSLFTFSIICFYMGQKRKKEVLENE